MKPSDYLQIPPPKELREVDIEALRKAFGFFYDEDPNHVYKAKDFTDPTTKRHFKDSGELIDELWKLGIPKDTSIKNIGIVLESWHENTTTSPKYESSNSTVPEAGTREIQAEELEYRTEAKKEADTKAKVDVQKLIERYKGRKIWAKPKDPSKIPTVTLSNENIEVLTKFRDLAQKHPGDLQKEIEQKIRDSIPEEEKRNVSDILIKNTANDVVIKSKNFPDQINNTQVIQSPNSPFTAFFDINNPDLKKEVPDYEVRKEFVGGAQDLAILTSVDRDVKETLTSSFLPPELRNVYFYNTTPTIYTITNEEDGQENGVEVDIKGLIDQAREVQDFVNKASKGEIDGSSISSSGVGPRQTFIPSEDVEVATEAKKAVDKSTALFDSKMNQKDLWKLYHKTDFTTPTLSETVTTELVESEVIGTSVLPIKSTLAIARATTATNEMLSLMHISSETPLLLSSGIAGQLASGGISSAALATLTTQGEVLYFAGIGKYSFSIVNLANASLNGQAVELYAAGFNFGSRGFGLGVMKVGGKIVSTGTITSAGGQVVAKTLPSFFTKIVTFIGGLTGPETLGLSVIITFAAKKIGELVNKIIPPEKLKKWLENFKEVIFGTGIAGLMIGATTGSIAALILGSFGVLIGGATAMATGGFSFSAGLSTLATGVSNIVGFVLATAWAGIGAPILFILIGLPTIIVLIMFIINSGAYIVPPSVPISGFNGTGIKVICSTDKGPVGIPGGRSASPIGNRAWQITSDLYQGFWCYWNRSPKAPPPYDAQFPNDKIDFPPSYPKLFNYSKYATDPNGAEGSYGSEDMFWCTWLIVKAYNESGRSIGTDLYVPTMFLNWPKNKIIDATQATADITSPNYVQTGSVVFFQVSGGEFSDRLNHVGIVYSTSKTGGVDVVESNGPFKHEDFAFGSGGVGLYGTNLMRIKYIGKP